MPKSFRYEGYEKNLIGIATKTGETLGLSESDFYETRDRTIFRAICQMRTKGIPVGDIELKQYLTDKGIEIEGGLMYIGGLIDNAINSNLGYQAQKIKQAARMRALWELGQRLSRAVESGESEKIEAIRNEIASLKLADSPIEAIPLKTVDDILSHDIDVDYYVDEIIPRGAVVLITGLPGLYKTWTALELGHNVSIGSNFLGRNSYKAHVYYVNNENPDSLLRDRIGLLGFQDSQMKFWNYSENPSPPSLYKVESYKPLAKDNSLLIFDSLIRFHNGDENSSRDMSEIMGNLRELTKEGASVVALHHRGKTEFAYRGSSEILAGVDVLYSLEKDEDILTLKVQKHRFLPEFNMCMRINTSNGFAFEVTENPRLTEERVDMDRIRGVIQGFNNCGVQPNQTQIVEQALQLNCGLSKHRALSLLKKGTGRLWTREDGKVKNEKVYSIENSVFQFSTPIYPETGKLKTLNDLARLEKDGPDYL